jgi:hypothetical protein
MATRRAVPVEPNDWQTVEPDDWQTVGPTHDLSQIPPSAAGDAWKAAVHSTILGVPPGYAYQNRDEIDKQMRDRDTDYDSPELDPTLANDIKAGWENSIFGLKSREQLPERIRNPVLMDRFVQGISQTVADLPVMIGGGLLGGAIGAAAGSEAPVVGNITVGGIGAMAGAFALPSAMREALVEGIKNGDVKDFPDLLRRSAKVVLAGGKGAAVGAATELAGGIPVGSLIAKSAIATTGVRSIYQAAALTTAADVLDGKLPTAGDFAGNAALIVPLNLIARGFAMTKGEAQDALMEVYKKDGRTPEESATILNAQPPVKEGLPPGLRPAIKAEEGILEGDVNDTHADIASRQISETPVTMERLEADPALADDVLQNPTIHEQDVIDRAWQLKKEALEAGGASPVVLDGDQLISRAQAARIRESADAGGWAGSDMQRVKINSRSIPEGKYVKTSIPLSDIDAAGGAQPWLVKEYAERAGKFPPSYGTLKQGRVFLEDGNHRLEAAKLRGDGSLEVILPLSDYATYYGVETYAETIEELYDRKAMKSGRGFVTPDGKFLTPEQARGWMKDNEPDVHDSWLESQHGDKKAEFHSEDYAAARTRVEGRNLAEGDETIANAPQNAQRLAAAREGLNKIKAGEASKGYGKEVIRTLFAGQRDTRIAATTQVRDAIAKVIPDSLDQEALSILRDYKDKPGELEGELEQIRSGDNARMKRLIPAIERALNPTAEMMRADGMMTDYYRQALGEGRELGFLDSTIDPANYSPHILTRILEGEPEEKGVGRPVMASSTPFAKERNYPTVLDAMRTGNLDARTVIAIDALSVYGDRHATVAATKILSIELRNTELGKYGTQQSKPDGWVELDPGKGTFRQTRAIIDPETGEPYVLSRNLYVPKDVADAMKPLFQQGLKGTGFAPLLKVQGYVKMLELGLSFFHMKALSITAFNNEGLAEFTKSLIADVNSADFAEAERGWAADGLTTTKSSTPYEAYKGLKPSSIPTGLDKLANAPLVKQIDAAFKWTTKETFDVIQRKFKVQDASLKIASWMAKHPDATNEQVFAARRSIAKEVNAAYGGLNWDVLGVGKTVRDVTRFFLLAPDWTYSNVLNARYAFEGGAAGSAARMFWLKSFSTGIGMTAAASIAIGGKYDPTDIRHIDQVYLGTDKDGKEMYANWFFAGAPKDAMTLLRDVASESPIGGTARFVVGKASPLLGMGFGLASNKEGGKPITSVDDTMPEKFGKQAKYVAGRVAPISGVSAVKTVSDALTDPHHEYSYRDLLELAADALGSQPIHYGDGETDRPAKKEKSILSVRKSVTSKRKLY